MKIFIAKLPYQYQEAEVNKLFAEFGEVSSVNLIMDRETGRSKCYAFVEMPNDEEATNAINNLDQKEVMNKPIAVSQAKERPERSSGGGGFQQRSGGGGFQSRNSGGGGGYNRDRNSGGGGYNRDRNSGGGNRDGGSYNRDKYSGRGNSGGDSNYGDKKNYRNDSDF